MTSPTALTASERAALDAFVKEFVDAWNRHDPEAMAQFWLDDGDLLNTRGHLAAGREDVQRVLTQEQRGAMRTSTAQMNVQGVRVLSADLILCDASMTLEGVIGPSGNTLPTLPLHVTFLARRRDAGWGYLAVRPYAFLSGF